MAEKRPPNPSRARAASKRREPLSRERIIAATIEIMDREGFNGFTMRKLGSALGVEAMSVYEYFKSKEELLLAVRGHFYSQLHVEVPPGTPWYEELRTVMMTSYRMGVDHPSFVAVHLHVVSVPESRRRGTRDMELLQGAGFSKDEAAGAMLALVSYVTGFQFRMVLTTPAANPLSHKSRDDAFQMGLDAILAGLRAHARSRQAE
ncbi:MAG: TetR/AcrR family transcriptional regulator [Dehalococcoidia bacterium]|nr:TetR/AcrR family transcriptional regulator [Dehalococcoidia bacterium]